jgi:hypothetical protein
MSGVQTIAGAYIVNLAPWAITDLHIEESGATPFPPFNTGTDAYTHYAIPFDYNKTIIQYGLPLSEGPFTFSVSTSGVTTETAQKDWNQDDSLPLVTRDSMMPVDNAYVMTDQPTLRWWAQGGTTYQYRARIQTWNGIVIWQSDWIPDGEVGQQLSVDVPAGVLRGGIYRWYVDVSDTNLRNMTRSQMLAFAVMGGEVGPGGFDELVVSFGATGLYHYNGLTWKKINSGQPQRMLGVGPDLYADFGSEVGLYKYNGTAWQRMNPNDATDMCAVNLQ